MVGELGLLDPSFQVEGRAIPVIPMSRYLPGREVSNLNTSGVQGVGTAVVGAFQVPSGRTWHVKNLFADFFATVSPTSGEIILGIGPNNGSITRILLWQKFTTLTIGARNATYLGISTMALEGEFLQVLWSSIVGAGSAITYTAGFDAKEYPMGVDKT